MKYIKIMSMIAFIEYIWPVVHKSSRKRNYIFYTRENKDTKEDAPVEKQQEQEKNEESQAIQTNEQVEHKQEEVSSEEKKEETTPVQPTEQPVQNNEQKVEGNENKRSFSSLLIQDINKSEFKFRANWTRGNNAKNIK